MSEMKIADDAADQCASLVALKSAAPGEMGWDELQRRRIVVKLAAFA